MTWTGEERRKLDRELNMDDLRQVIAEAVENVLSSKAEHYPSEHKAFVESLLLKEQRKQELWNEVKKKAIVWATISVLGYVAYLAWDGLKHTIKFDKTELPKIHVE